MDSRVKTGLFSEVIVIPSINDQLKEYEVKFNALSNQIRLEIMYTLGRQGKTSVVELYEMFEYKLLQSQLSYHLKILLDAHLVTKEAKGSRNYYSINKEEVNMRLVEGESADKLTVNLTY